MKLDKIGFARLIGFLERVHALNLGQSDIELIDEIIDVAIPEALMMNPETLHVLMALMQEGTRKIEAIKQHRMMTGYGLKESKDIVEKYWPTPSPVVGWTKEELMNKINMHPPTADYAALKSFINNL